MKLRAIAIIAILGLTGCGYHFGHKEVVVWDAKGDKETVVSCGGYLYVGSDGWIQATFNLSFTDSEGLAHEAYGLKQVVISDIPSTVNAPMWNFDNYVPGERYANKPDGSLGDVIRNGDVVVRGNNSARLLNGKWTPVKIANNPCEIH